MPDWLVSLLTALVITGGGYLATRYQYRKDKLDISEQLRAMAEKMALDLEDERKKRRKLETLFDKAMSIIRRLLRQLDDAGMTPCVKPEEIPTTNGYTNGPVVAKPEVE